MQLTPYEILSNGTRVQVRDKRGEVIGHEVASNWVVVHTVKLTEKRIRKLGNIYKWEPCNSKWRGNYSFVQTI